MTGSWLNEEEEQAAGSRWRTWHDAVRFSTTNALMTSARFVLRTPAALSNLGLIDDRSRGYGLRFYGRLGKRVRPVIR